MKKSKDIDVKDLTAEAIFDELSKESERVKQLVAEIVIRAQTASYLYGKYGFEGDRDVEYRIRTFADRLKGGV